MRVFLGQFCLILMLFVISPAIAQDQDWQKIGSFAPPTWQTVPDPEVESRKDIVELETEDGRQIIYELIPKAQSNSDWRKRHWVYVAENVKKPILRVRNAFLSREGEGCATEPKWADWDKSQAEIVFVYFCGERRADGLGYVTAVWIAKEGSTLLRVSEEWRGAPYEFGAEDTYFWERRELSNLIEVIGSSELN